MIMYVCELWKVSLFCFFLCPLLDFVFSESKQFCVATTHLLYNPKAGEVKLAQMSCLFAELHRIATVSGKPSPLYVCMCNCGTSDKGHSKKRGQYSL